MTALSDEELTELGFGTMTNPNVAVHFDLFPHVYFTEARPKVGTTVDDKGGKIFANRAEAEEYANKQFDALVEKEMARFAKFKSLIPKRYVIPFAEQDDMKW